MKWGFDRAVGLKRPNSTCQDLFLMSKAVWRESPAEEPPQHGDQHGEKSVEPDVQCPLGTTERALVNKIDWRVIPFLCIMYLLAFLDR
jgi:hypothetical protein